MQLKLNDEERGFVQHALESYLSDLREEIARTEKHEWRQPLHKDEQTLKSVIGRLNWSDDLSDTLFPRRVDAGPRLTL